MLATINHIVFAKVLKIPSTSYYAYVLPVVFFCSPLPIRLGGRKGAASDRQRMLKLDPLLLLVRQVDFNGARPRPSATAIFLVISAEGLQQLALQRRVCGDGAAQVLQRELAQVALACAVRAEASEQLALQRRGDGDGAARVLARELAQAALAASFGPAVRAEALHQACHQRRHRRPHNAGRNVPSFSYFVSPQFCGGQRNEVGGDKLQRNEVVINNVNTTKWRVQNQCAAYSAHARRHELSRRVCWWNGGGMVVLLWECVMSEPSLLPRTFLNKPPRL